jgi:hypothetical protein
MLHIKPIKLLKMDVHHVSRSHFFEVEIGLFIYSRIKKGGSRG